MNKRQRKKIARIENNWYKEKGIEDYDCPCCSWCALNDEEMKYHKKLTTERSYLGRIDWEFEVKCPYCNTVFSYWDSNV